MKKIFLQISVETELPLKVGEYVTDQGKLTYNHVEWRDALGFSHSGIEWWLKETEYSIEREDSLKILQPEEITV